ncbi:Conserved_hypothetical protein [Hexamita inflata]|uniref:Uncharacterized protein n=1 Tax=Hexamita inflata TaxID=28002 RepID=A0AA86RNV6_9EUKA|nr:Conserved hypothetical protein [Hexamita inflata]
MIYLICIFSELTRAQKVEIFNCFTNLADINLFADTKNIIITLQTTNNQACDLPHGIKVSLQIDSLGVYEPYTYVKDYDYATTTTIYLKCSNAGCSSIPSSASGIIIIESKTKVTRIPAGSLSHVTPPHRLSVSSFGLMEFVLEIFLLITAFG